MPIYHFTIASISFPVSSERATIEYLSCMALEVLLVRHTSKIFFRETNVEILLRGELLILIHLFRLSN